MKLNNSKKLFSIAGLLVVFGFLILGLAPLEALAQATAPAQTTAERCAAFKSQFSLSGGANIINAPVYCSASELTLKIINYIIAFSGTITILFLIIGGFMYLTSAGNEEATEKGKKILVNSVIGLVIIIMSFAIVRIVASTLTLK